MEYLFEISAYDAKNLTNQVALALEKRTELVSRELLPGMWKMTDKLNSLPKVSKETSRKRTTRATVYGVILLILGIILLVPGLMRPKELWDCLLAGIFGVSVGLFCLLGWLRGGISSRYVKSARSLLTHLDGAKGVMVRFTDKEMLADGGSAVPYGEFSLAVETRDAFVLVWGEQATILQKKDLKKGKPEGFLPMLEENSGGKIRCITL